MATATSPSHGSVSLPPSHGEQRVLLPRSSWQVYQQVATARGDAPLPRLGYLQGALELMSPSFRHEVLARRIDAFVLALARGLALPCIPAGSTRWEKAGLDRGKEPDGSFYIEHAPNLLGRKEISLEHDGPPDLVVEVEITRPLLDAIEIYRLLAVPELWRHDGEVLSIHCLQADKYMHAQASRVFPGLRAWEAQGLLAEADSEDFTTWQRRVEAFAHDELAPRK